MSIQQNDLSYLENQINNLENQINTLKEQEKVFTKTFTFDHIKTATFKLSGSWVSHHCNGFIMLDDNGPKATFYFNAFDDGFKDITRTTSYKATLTMSHVAGSSSTITITVGDLNNTSSQSIKFLLFFGNATKIELVSTTSHS